ncbi:type IV pilus modification protein PilV [Halomonas sp. HP20-15]|uniref:type IV pilus modification protein PilV n=1 Tax=Halomonas sp. HP20-15 TaxID=3085901 RepID=UPI0029811AB3|nr:type IV pilus modification protein PilV [Halomonas sp. HP20-15]MDW5376192.1 type IV pilus modification protein PilV [Halomonas sp. HP20-15]
MRQAGVSLIESLIALLLISIALLGIAGLQLVTLQDARDARWRVEATSLASAALERMRASPDQAEAFMIDYDDDTFPNCAGGGSICSGMHDWLGEVQRALPNGAAKIAVAKASEVAQVTISLHWRQQPAEANDPLPSCGTAADSGGCVMLETRL